MLEEIQALSRQYFLRTMPDFQRKFVVDWRDRLIGIRGAKGTGKTTFILQALIAQYGKIPSVKEVLYLSLDHPLLATHSLLEITKQFVRHGGKKIVFDEVHYFQKWTEEIKAIYDLYPELLVVFSGSSIINLSQAKSDLSRRASVYDFTTLSFAEYVRLETGVSLPTLSLKELVENHEEVSQEIITQIKPLEFFEDYVRYGAYPFFREGITKFHEKLVAVVNHTIESDLVLVRNLDSRAVMKLKRLIYLIATSLPFVPNISNIAQATELSRAAVNEYLEHLQDGAIISLLRQEGEGYKKLSKPEKIYLDNTNLLHAFGTHQVVTGTLRETFVAQSLRRKYAIEIPSKGDFIAEGYTFEVGGKKKTLKQIKELSGAYVISDDIEIGTARKIPLWMMGLL